MLFSMYIIKDRRTKISNLLKNIKEDQEDLSLEKGRYNGFIYDILLALNEIDYLSDTIKYGTLKSILTISLKDINNSKTSTEMTFILERVIIELNEIDTNANAYYFGSYSFINSRISQCIANNINNLNRPFTVFHPECRDGYLLQETKNINKHALLYGLEKDNYLAEKAKEVADKVIKGEIQGSRISNDAFDIVYCLTHIKETLQDNMSCGAIAKKEKMTILNMLKYVRVDGVFMAVIPFFRMHKDICTLFAKNLYNVTVVKGMDTDENRGLIYVIGQKSKSKELDENIYESLRKCYNYNNVKYMHELELPTFKLQATSSSIDIFKGSVLDEDELLNIVQHSGCMDAFFEKQKVKKIHENTIRPLLPFNVGQIGLVLTSGCLDGIIDEGDGNYHLVKGRVSKKTDTERTSSNGVVEETEVISNRVEINVILPDGKFKTLA